MVGGLYREMAIEVAVDKVPLRLQVLLWIFVMHIIFFWFVDQLAITLDKYLDTTSSIVPDTFGS